MGPSIALSAQGTWWVSVGGVLYQGSERSRVVRKVRLPTVLGLGARCSEAGVVEVHGRAVWVTAANRCAVLFRSLDGGQSFAPIRSTAFGVPAGIGTDEVVAFGSGPTVYVLGSGESPRAAMVVARSGDDGRTWAQAVLPCKRGWSGSGQWTGGFIAARGSNVVAGCFAGAAAETFGVEIVDSSDGGDSWREKCGNDFLGLTNELGECPGIGVPSVIGFTRDGDMTMMLDNVGVATSSDDGQKWTLTKQFDDGWVTVSISEGVLWALDAFVPARLATSVNASAWHSVPLPSH